MMDTPTASFQRPMVPHLVTALTGPINELEQRILESTPVIERWFRLEWMEHTPPFYTSVDVRNAGFKLAPVNTNLFPGGWNHLTPEMIPLAVQAAMAATEQADLLAVARQLAEEGVLLRDPTTGLIDFAARAPDGRPYWLCWMWGEPEIDTWHWIEDGFAGRTSVEELPT